jgi:hypothetical protein
LVVWRAGVSAGSFIAYNMRFEDSGSNVNHRYLTAYDEFAGSRVVVAHGGTSRVIVGYLASSALTAGGQLMIPNYTVAPSAIPFWYQSFVSTGGATVRSVQGSGFVLGQTDGVGIDRVLTNASSGTLAAGSTVEVYGLGKK